MPLLIFSTTAAVRWSEFLPRGVLSLGCGVAMSIFFGVGHIAHAAERPNIIFVLADDVGWGDIAAYNAKSQVRLPSLEQLAADGIRFTDAHTPAAKCAPSRYSIMTGNYQWRGLFSWGQWNYKGGSQILAGQRTLGDVLSEAGYTTAVFGKYHLGGNFYVRDSNAFAKGKAPDASVDFARPIVAGASQKGFDYSFLALRGIQNGPYAFFENDQLVGSVKDLIHWDAGDYGDTAILESGIGVNSWNTRDVGPTLLEKALAFIDNHRSGNDSGSPFFIYFNTQAVHSPRKPPVALGGRDILGSTGLGDRADMLVEIDVTVEQLLLSLEKHGLADDTLFIFSSDNGGLKVAREIMAGHETSGGLRGDKGKIYEGGHRVPLIIKWGESGFVGSSLRSGTALPGLVGIQDLVTTLAELVGVVPAADQVRDSISILPYLRGETTRSPRDHMVHESDAVETGNRRLYLAYRSGDWKLLFDQNQNPVELYNLATDIKESQNVINAPENAALVQRLTVDFKAARASYRTTPAPGSSGIAAPTDLTGTVMSLTTVVLNWRDNSMNETGFRLERRIESGSWLQIGRVGANITRFTNSGLNPSTPYGYRVRAVKLTDTSPYSNEIVVTTGGGTLVPAPPTLLKATAVSRSRIDLSWKDNSNNETGFRIERKTGAGTWTQIAGVGPDITNFISRGLSGSTRYAYRVRAYNSAGNSAYSNRAFGTTR